MKNKDKGEITYSRKYFRTKSMEDCNVSKASSEIMLDRISVNNQNEFPFLNSL